jgi:diguanylate cyclase (GGDEF)-like protein/PAS domain S-box-containing protein
LPLADVPMDADSRASFASFSKPLPEAVVAGRVALLYRQAIPGLLVSLVVAAITAAVLWPAVDHAAIAGWLGAVALITALRYLLVRAYARRTPAPDAAAAWETRFALGAAAMGVAWGVLASGINPADYPRQVFVAFIVGGIAIGAMGVLSASRRSFIALVVPMLGAQVAELALLGGDLYPAMALLVVVFLAVVVRVFSDLHRTIMQNIERGIANERLLAEQRGLFEAATAGILFLRELRVVDCNRELERIVGYPRAELIGHSVRMLFPDQAVWEAKAEEGYRTALDGRQYRTEVEVRRKDGTSVWCDVSGQSVVPGRPELGVVVVCADITERRRAEAALRKSEERLELAVQASQSGLWDWDLASNATYFSPRFKEILGYAGGAEFHTLFFFSDRLHPEDRERAMARMARCVDADEPFDCEYRLRRADGAYVWVHGRGRTVRDAKGVAVRFAGAIVDISDRKAVEERLRESESHFRHLVETANDLVWAVDRDGRWTYLSPRATRQIFGCEPEDMLAERLVDSQPEPDRERTAAMLARVMNDGTASHFETVHRNRRGGEAVLSLNATPLRNARGAIVGVTGTATDITELKAKEHELSEALGEQRLIFDSVSEGLVLVRNRVIQKCNAKFAEMLGYSSDELAGQPTLTFYADPAEWDYVGRQARTTMAQGLVFECELLVRRKDGSAFWCELRGRAIDPAAVDDGSIWVVFDISARKEREQRIQHLADHDALTGLLNRRLLEDRLQQSITLARRNDALVAVMLIDLDGFKAVNDQFGHLMGDYALRTVARRLRECVRESDTIARLGGDEFVVLLSGQRVPDDSSLVAEKILGALTEPVAAGGRRFEIGASIGISIYPRDGTTPEALLRHADAAMYRVKEAGKNRYQYYSI